MILRRITEPMKDQNWFAVGIELVILVLGVFIGIQVANWNEARKDRAVQLELHSLLDAKLAIKHEVEPAR